MSTDMFGDKAMRHIVEAEDDQIPRRNFILQAITNNIINDMAQEKGDELVRNYIKDLERENRALKSSLDAVIHQRDRAYRWLARAMQQLRTLKSNSNK